MPLQPKADADVPLPAPNKPAVRVPAGESVGCFAVLSRLWEMLMSLLSPSHDYAKQDKTDLLGDPAQLSGFAADDESWRTQRKKLNRVELPPPARKRVLRDLRQLKAAGSGLGIAVDDAECLTDWVVSMVGANGTVYQGEIYRLRVRFHPEYPVRPPEVRFMRPAPVHEHIYSDGKICLNILYSDWDPKMDVKSLCLSLLSMLSSAKKKSRPPDNNQTVVLTQGQQAGSMQRCQPSGVGKAGSVLELRLRHRPGCGRLLRRRTLARATRSRTCGYCGWKYKVLAPASPSIGDERIMAVSCMHTGV
eukprot:scaffold2231_cov106-Isochrysis_galbana.AAC.2